jgi:4-hydroxy-2-oxoheptanedioate aldolase
MTRINRVIELLSQDQPVFYSGSHSGFELTYENGKTQSATEADYFNIGMEHGAFDMAGLDQFMRGLVAGGPTRSGHRTPAVIVEAPVIGESEEAIRYNTWQFRQILGRGVHGILLCHVETAAAVKAFVEVCRFPRNQIGVGTELGVGTRGVGGQGAPAEIWGVTSNEYVDKADPWPLNPSGELVLGLKIENLRALENAEESLAVPGIAFAEWGPGDMAMAMGLDRWEGEGWHPQMFEARERIRAACIKNNVAFLEGLKTGQEVQQFDDGVRISNFDNAASAAVARKHAGRKMPI